MMNKIIIVTIIVLSLVFSCNTVKNNEEKKNDKINNPLENTCWAIDYIVDNGDSTKMELKINLAFKENGVCNISGMKTIYKLKDNELFMDGYIYKEIELSENKLKMARYRRERFTFYEIYHRIDCDSVNEIFKGFDKY